MTIASGVKLAALLPVAAADLEATLREHVGRAPGRPGVVANVFGLAAEAAAGKLREALDVDLIELIAGAWLKIEAVREYRDPSRYPPGKVAVVPLAQHDIVSTHDAVIDAEVAGVPLPELRLKVELTARFKSVALSIEGGRVVAIAPGECAVIVRLKYGAKLLKEQSTPALQLPGRISLGEGLAIP